MTSVTFLYATAPDETFAIDLARSIVENTNAACVNIIPGMKSVYRWQGRIDCADDVVLIVKTTSDEAAIVRDFILARHPYDNPAIAAIAIDEARSSRRFCDWIRNPRR